MRKSKFVLASLLAAAVLIAASCESGPKTTSEPLEKTVLGEGPIKTISFSEGDEEDPKEDSSVTAIDFSKSEYLLFDGEGKEYSDKDAKAEVMASFDGEKKELSLTGSISVTATLQKKLVDGDSQMYLGATNAKVKSDSGEKTYQALFEIVWTEADKKAVASSTQALFTYTAADGDVIALPVSAEIDISTAFSNLSGTYEIVRVQIKKDSGSSMALSAKLDSTKKKIQIAGNPTGSKKEDFDAFAGEYELTGILKEESSYKAYDIKGLRLPIAYSEEGGKKAFSVTTAGKTGTATLKTVDVRLTGDAINQTNCGLPLANATIEHWDETEEGTAGTAELDSSSQSFIALKAVPMGLDKAYFKATVSGGSNTEDGEYVAVLDLSDYWEKKSGLVDYEKTPTGDLTASGKLVFYKDISIKHQDSNETVAFVDGDFDDTTGTITLTPDKLTKPESLKDEASGEVKIEVTALNTGKVSGKIRVLAKNALNLSGTLDYEDSESGIENAGGSSKLSKISMAGTFSKNDFTVNKTSGITFTVKN